MTDVHHEQHNAQHDHDHDHSHEHGHDHDHHKHSWWESIASALHVPGFSHTHERPAVNDALYANELGISTVRRALIVLGLTTIIQIVIYLASRSVALLADTVHNFGDALNSIPLLIAFLLLRRSANRRYTYGYGRAEDVAGLLIVLSIVFSAGYILWESFQKLLHPVLLTNLGWVAAASLVGFAGNEMVAMMQIRVGRQIGSEAMIADGKHARIDGLTSLAVLIAVIGAWLGYPIVDPIVGLVIGVAIIFIAREATIAMWHRLMDAVDPSMVEDAEQVVISHPEVKAIERMQMRWIGHRLHANVIIALEGNLPLARAEEITDHIRHHLLHKLPHLDDVMISIVPWQGEAHDYWRESGHHRLHSANS
jgi:cation diffusion facilitator family transporter